jgi:ribonuclease P protein component
MTARRSETIGPAHRLRAALDIAAVKRGARVVRGRHCLVLVIGRPGEPSKVGFVASRRGVGNAVRRNRARRRLREIVRRRWPRCRPRGVWLLFVAFASSVTAPHPDLVDDVERLLEEAGAVSGGASS